MHIYKIMVATAQDAREAEYLQNAHTLGFQDLRQITVQDLYFIEGQLSHAQIDHLIKTLLADPLTQIATYTVLPDDRAPPDADVVALEVALLPGVTDPVAEQFIRAAQASRITGLHRVATGTRFLMTGLSVAQVEHLAKALLANHVIQHWHTPTIAPSFPLEAESSATVEKIPVAPLSDSELLALAEERRAALDLEEMRAIQSYFATLQREPTDVEFETIAQTWSEHCCHKTFKAFIALRANASRKPHAYVNALLKHYLKATTDNIDAPWVVSAFSDNAGVIAFDDTFDVAFKVETHNHPSAIEPFGGANTGVGGVMRDVLGVSAKPIALTDVLCFGPPTVDPQSLPAGVLHPRRVQAGVVAGIQDYGNKIGVPTVNGAIVYDSGFAANPLVFCGCVGLAPKGKHRKQPQIGDRVVVLGGRTGRDGLRGATFSSMTMDARTGDVAGASVQIGNPITGKGLIDVVTRAKDLDLYNDITDCGAGGLSSAIGEMAATIGCDVDLHLVKLKYAGLAPWEIWLSEAQERMVVAVAPAKLTSLRDLCATFDTELTDIGSFTGDGVLRVRHGNQTVANLDGDFLHHGMPQRRMDAVTLAPSATPPAGAAIPDPLQTFSERLLRLLRSPNIASKAAVIRRYDHEVQGGSVVRPLVGLHADAPSDAAVIKPIGTQGVQGIALANGINPEFGKRDAYKMAWSVMDEAIRNAVAVGADPARIAVLDNFCWGDPRQPEILGTLVEACRGCHDAAFFYHTPFISGKDSLNNEFIGADGLRHAIPPTLLISALGIVPNVNQAVTMDLKMAGNAIYLLGDFPRQELPVPEVSVNTPLVYQVLHTAIVNGLVRAAHDLSEGGLAVAAAEMCIGGRLGMALTFAPAAPFWEVNGCLLVEIAPADAAAFDKLCAGVTCAKIGVVTATPVFKFNDQKVEVADLAQAFNHHA